MFSLIVRRSVFSFSSRLTRPLSISPISRNFPDMKQMMDEMSKNPKAMALFKAIEKDPKILQSVQELMTIMTRKGFIDMKNPTRQPNLSMLMDNEVRTKLFELIKLLGAAGIFNSKDGSSPADALTKIMGFLSPSTNKEKSSESSEEKKPKYDFTYDTTTKKTNVDSNATGWSEKLKKIFK